MMQNRRLARRFAVIVQLIVISALSSLSLAQASHSIISEFGTRVEGPDSTFTIVLSMTPADIDISGFSLLIGYNSNQAELVAVSDNTLQPQAGVSYTMGQEQPMTGVPDINVCAPVTMTTAFNLQEPNRLAELTFRSSSTYNDPQGRIDFHVDSHIGAGLTDGDLDPMPVAYMPLDQESSVPDWALY